MSKARPRPPVVPLHQLPAGQAADCFALLVSKVRGTTRDQKPYYTVTFQDKLRRVEAKIWQDSHAFADCEQSWQPGQSFKIRGVYSEHERYGPQLEIQQIRPTTADDEADGFQLAALMERSRFASEDLLQELLHLAQTELTDEPLKHLVTGLLTTHAERLRELLAHPTRFYNYPGGWLEHVRNVAKTALMLVDYQRQLYPDGPTLNRDLVLAGALLHDLGRVAELMPALPAAVPERTIPGQLFGPVLLARDMVRDAARAIPALHPQLLELLEHMILSHLVIPEWGSVRQPAIPEVLILHHADDLDAKLELYRRSLQTSTSEGPFTERDGPAGRALLKQRDV